MKINQNKRNQPNPQSNPNQNHPPHTPKAPPLHAEVSLHCHPMAMSRPFPSHPAPAPRPTLLQPEEGLVQLLHLGEVQQPRLLTGRHGCGRASGAPAAPGLSVRGGRGEPCREGTQTKPAGQRRPRHDAPAPERLTPPAALTCSPVPGERGDTAPQGRAEGSGHGTSWVRDELSGSAQPCPGRGPPPEHPGAAPVPQRGPARSQSRRGAPGRGSLTPVTLRARPGAAGAPRQAPHGRPAALRGERCPPQPFHHTHERGRRAAEAPLPAEGDGCRGRAEPGLELPAAAAPGWFSGQ